MIITSYRWFVSVFCRYSSDVHTDFVTGVVWTDADSFLTCSWDSTILNHSLSSEHSQGDTITNGTVWQWLNTKYLNVSIYHRHNLSMVSCLGYLVSITDVLWQTSITVETHCLQSHEGVFRYVLKRFYCHWYIFTSSICVQVIVGIYHQSVK